MASVYEKITSALSALGKRRDRDSGAQDGAHNAAASAGVGSRAAKRFRPWDQSDLHGRLETYKPLTWFAKPASVGPVPCALRGWVNTGSDTLCCEHCKAQVRYPAQVPYDQRQAAADLFSPSLTAKHAPTCPWRQTQCDASLLSYVPSASNDELCQIFQSLQGKLLKVDVLPDLDAIAIQAVRNAAAPYGSYEDTVLGGGGGGASSCWPPRRPPTVHISHADPDAEGAPSQELMAVGDASDSATYIVQPSKLTPQQKARLLALLGWDLDVLQPNTASGSAALPYTQSTGYSLQHLGVKTQKQRPAAAAAAAPGAEDGDACGRHPMSSVVLKCQRCNSRMGLWNFAGVRPVPTGRLTPSHQADGAAALLSPRAAGGPAAVAAAGADPLSTTIAGGQYGLHGVAGPRPFGAASSTPFRFGAGGGAEPVFGMGALEAEAPQQGGGGGFGSPLGSPAPKAIGAASLSTPAAAGGRGAGSGLAGHKRKAQEQGTPEAMAIETDQAAGLGALDGKRARLTPQAGVGASPQPGHTPGGEEGQPRQLDPVNQHRSWCPWVYAGTAENRQMAGWQHMLSAVTAQQQQQAAGPTEMQQDGHPTLDPKQLRDKSLAVIRSL